MISDVECKLIQLLKSLDFDQEFTVATSVLAKNDENRRRLIDSIIVRYKKKGVVTEEDINKMGLMLTGDCNNLFGLQQPETLISSKK